MNRIRSFTAATVAETGRGKYAVDCDGQRRPAEKATSLAILPQIGDIVLCADINETLYITAILDSSGAGKDERQRTIMVPDLAKLSTKERFEICSRLIKTVAGKMSISARNITSSGDSVSAAATNGYVSAGTALLEARQIERQSVLHREKIGSSAVRHYGAEEIKVDQNCCVITNRLAASSSDRTEIKGGRVNLG